MSQQNVIAMNMKYGKQSLQYFFKQGKFNEEEYNQVAGVIQSLFKLNTDSQRIFNTLAQTMRMLKNDINAVKQEYEAASNKQAKAIEQTQKTSRTLKSAEVAYQSQKASYQNLLFECEQLEKEVANAQVRMREGFRSKEEKSQPQMDKYRVDIQQCQALNEKTRGSIETLQRQLEDNVLKVTNLKRTNTALLEEEEHLKEVNLKIKDSPDHYAKSAQNLNVEIRGMQAEVRELKEEIERKRKICAVSRERMKTQKDSIDGLQEEQKALFAQCQEIETGIQSTRNAITGREMQREDLKLSIAELESSTAEVVKESKMQKEIISITKKEIQKLVRKEKKEEGIKIQQEQIIMESKLFIDKVLKEIQSINGEIRRQDVQENSIKENIAVVADKVQSVEMKTTQTKSRQKQIQNEIYLREKELGVLRSAVSELQKEIKDATALRESMARKASSAVGEVRDTREELKVKKLLILDLTKKYHETENKLADFKAFYEQVKSARNKYVNMIQNSSQDLAEVKERIKILQNELQILKNESSEKNKTIQQYKQMMQERVHLRDQTKAKLNKLQLTKKETKEMVDQHINEIQKLNMIILTLQKDMQALRSQYEQACEHRNLTGIQLIDRNDQLCILYEKANVQQNILHKSQMILKDTEDQLRMIRIEIQESERKIAVAQEKMPLVPLLSADVLRLQGELKEAQARENELSRQLEDPENLKRWRELKGEDPDEEALDAKISIIEERLNSKKEQLLEKELILDQVTELSKGLKKDAVDGRLSTLEVSERVNQFQSRLRELTRKMKATISQLAMCQAKSIKLHSERQELERELESAGKRMEDGLPPTPETEVEYLKMIRDRKRYQEEKRIRQQREIAEQNYPPFATKTTANQRVNSYIPDEIGLPKPYGSNAPFMYQSPGANMRHFRKPKIQQIEI